MQHTLCTKSRIDYCSDAFRCLLASSSGRPCLSKFFAKCQIQWNLDLSFCKGVEKTNDEYGGTIRKTTFFLQKKSYIVFCGWSLESRLQDGHQRYSHPRLKYLSVQELIRAHDWTQMSSCTDRYFKLGWLLHWRLSWRRDCWISFTTTNSKPNLT
jgi:hypothetical protein